MSIVGMGRRGRLLAAAGGVVALVGIAFGGVVLAQTGGGSTPTPNGQNKSQRQAQAQQLRDQVLNDFAKNLGVERSKLDSALKQTADDQIDAAQQAGKITADQATKAKQQVDSGNIPFGLGGLGRFAFGGPGKGTDGIGTVLQACAQAAQNARAQGNDAVAAAVKPCLDQAVSSQQITADQETKILDGIKAGKGPFVGGPHGPGGPGKRPGARPNATPMTQ